MENNQGSILVLVSIKSDENWLSYRRLKCKISKFPKILVFELDFLGILINMSENLPLLTLIALKAG